MDRGTIRETGSSDSNRPAPSDIDGSSRAKTLEALLAAHVEPPDPTEHVPAHRFWARMTILRLGRLTVGALALNIIWGTGPALACEASVVDGKPLVTNCAPVSPAQAAALVSPGVFKPSPLPPGRPPFPLAIVAPYEGERHEVDFLRAARTAAAHRWLRDLVPAVPAFGYGAHVYGPVLRYPSAVVPYRYPSHGRLPRSDR